MKKRWLTLTLCLSLCMALVPAAAAEERLPQTPPLPQPEFVLVEEPGAGNGEEAGLLAEPDYAGALEALRKGIAARAEKIDLRAYNIPADREVVEKLMHDVRYRYAELFALDPSQGGRFGALGGVLSSYTPPYLPEMDAAGFAQAKAFYDGELQAIVDQVPQGFSDAEKVLFIHDYLAAHYEYDNDFAIYDAYNFLKEGKGVCQAYMLTFSALMDKLGVPVSYVESDYLNHAWNVVELGGNWYHVDVTWDDPTNVDVLGGARHQYFLLSDETNEALRRAYAEKNAAQLNGPYVNDQLCGRDVTCADKSYETGPWAQAESPVVYVAGEESWYYISTNSEDKGLYRWSGDPDQAPVPVEGYTTNYSGSVRPLLEYRGCLFFADPAKVCRYEPATGEVETLCTAPAGETYYYSGICVQDGVLSTKAWATGELTALPGPLLPRHEVDDGLFSYYYNFGQVDITPGEAAQDQRFLVSWRDSATGQMTALRQVPAAGGTFGTAVTDKDLECTLFILCGDGTLAPVRPKFLLNPQPTGNG